MFHPTTLIAPLGEGPVYKFGPPANAAISVALLTADDAVSVELLDSALAVDEPVASEVEAVSVLEPDPATSDEAASGEIVSVVTLLEAVPVAEPPVLIRASIASTTVSM